MNNTLLNILTICRDIAPLYVQETAVRINSYVSTKAESVTYPNTTRNDILGMIAAINNIKLFSGTFFLNELTEQDTTTIPEKIKSFLELKEASDNAHYDYKTFTVYLNSDISELKLSGYKEITTSNIKLFFTTLRKSIAENYGAASGSPELATDKLFINEDKDTLVYVTDYYTTAFPTRNSSLHYLAGENFRNAREQVLLALSPVYFPTLKEKLNDTELEVFKRLTNVYTFNTPSLDEKLKTLALSSKYQDAIKPKLKEKFSALLKRNKTRALETRENDLISDIENETVRIRHLETELCSIRKDLFFANNTTTAETEDDVNYIFDHPYIASARATRDDIIELAVRLPLSAWDLNVAKTIIENLNKIMEQNSINREYRGYITSFFKHVFIKQDVTYWVNSEISFGAVNGTRYSIRNHTNIASDSFIETCRATQSGFNPHLEFYGCVGSHETNILKALRTRNLPMIVEALFAPLKNWNLTDGAVVNRALRDMFPILIEKEIPCLENEDGDMITLKQLYEFDQKKQETETPTFTNADPLTVEDTNIETFTEED